MKVSKRIIIEENDVSGLHSELTDIVHFFVENSVSGEDDSWVKREFPNIVKLQRLLATSVIEEPGALIYERLNSQIKEQESNKISARRRLIHAIDKTQ